MSKPRIEPHRVTKPIQLLAAWLAGLVLVDAAFLGTAATITEPSWAPGALVIAAIFNVPLFIVCIFVLQTRYRPEMQEDTYYSKYLDSQTRTVRSAASQEVTALRAEIFQANSRTLEIIEAVQDRIATLVNSAKSSSQPVGERASYLSSLPEEGKRTIQSIGNAKQLAFWERYSLAINDLLPEYPRIRQTLSDASIPISQIFGSTSESAEVPKVGVLSFGPNVDLEAIRTLVGLLEKHKIQYVSHSRGEMHSARIYIGSYIYQTGDDTYTTLSGVIEEALNDPSTTIESFARLVQDRTPGNR